MKSAQLWVGNDVPDFKPDSHPKDHMGPFIMLPEGVGRIFAPLANFADGPFPEHYEPMESPVDNALHPKQNNNPVVKKYTTPADKYGTAAEGYNIVCTTYRMTEHYHYWTKNNPMNVQLSRSRSSRFPQNWRETWASRATTRSKSPVLEATTSPRPS